MPMPDTRANTQPATTAGTRTTGIADQTQERVKAWTGYWASGALHSLAGSFKGNYDGAIRTFWAERLKDLHRGHRMLDIGTGNGALPRLALEIRADSCPQIDAIDIAVLAPGWHGTLPAETRERLRFHGDTHAERLPFADGTFDLAVSQYGFEYTSLPQAAAEVARVLRTGAELALIMHHAESRLHAVASTEAEQAGQLCRPDGFLQRARELLPYLAMASRGQLDELRRQPAAAQAREAFNTAARELGEAIAAAPEAGLAADVRDHVFGLLQALQQARLGEADARAHLSSYRDAVAQAHIRSAELCRHALSETDMARLLNLLQDAGFHTPRQSRLHHEGMLMGWTLQATRA